MKQEITKELLEQLYLIEGMSTRDLAKYFNVGQTTIRRKLAKFDIPTRSSTEAKTTKFFKNKEQDINSRISKTLTQYNLDKGITEEKVCKFCGKTFIASSLYGAVYCSSECYKNALEVQKEQTKSKKRYCKDCGKEVSGRKQFCDDCIALHRKNAALKQRKRIKVSCAYCGKELEIIPALIKEHKNHYCDRECMAKYYAEHYTGKNSPTWKGGKRHYQGNWLHQRNLARKRDNYTCQLCKVTESEWHKEMDVHHIVNYRLFEDKIEANNLDNLVCLCNKCHSFVHSKSNVEKLFIKDKI